VAVFEELGIDLDALERARATRRLIAPLAGLADRIVDLVSSGETLRENPLRDVETLLPVSARLCLGLLAAKLHGSRLDELIGRLRETGAIRASQRSPKFARQ
jgi:ATP phosphoribosyltransferase